MGMGVSPCPGGGTHPSKAGWGYPPSPVQGRGYPPWTNKQRETITFPHPTDAGGKNGEVEKRWIVLQSHRFTVRLLRPIDYSWKLFLWTMSFNIHSCRYQNPRYWGIQGGTRDAPPLLGPIFFIFKQFSGETAEIIGWRPHLCGWCPKSWISHCLM